MPTLFADASRASLREIVEPTNQWGAVPGAGVSRLRRFVSSSIVVTKDTAVSAEIRDDRMTASVIETAAMSGGDINWEFAAGSQDNDFERVLEGSWTRPMTFDVFRGKIVSIVANNQIAIAGDDVSAYFTVGRRIKTEGFKTAANNDYAQVSAVAYAAGVTTVTVGSTTFVAETGNVGATVRDANDVVLLKNNTIRFGASTNAIDSNGGNTFSAAVAAKQLVSGQRIFIEGVGYEKGVLSIVDNAADGALVTVNDGTNELVFEAQSDSDIADSNAILFAVGVDDAATAANLAAAINAARLTDGLNVVAVASAEDVTVTNLNKVGGALASSDASVGVTDFTGGDADLGGFYTILTATNDKLTLDRAVPVLAAGVPVTIKASMLRNPSRSADIIPHSISLETGFQDVSQFFVADGLRAGDIELDITAGAIITGKTSFQGRQTVRRNTELLASQAYTALDAAATENISATANVGDLIIDGEVGSSAIQSIKMTINGNLRSQKAVGNKFPAGISAGKLGITGTVGAYFADGALYDRFLNHETMSLAFPLIDPDKNTYYFTIPAFKILSSPVAPGGQDQDVMEEMNFTAFRDVATKCMVQLDRFSSVAPITAL